MRALKEIINDFIKPNKTFGDYFNYHNLITRQITKEGILEKEKIKIGILSSFTFKGIKEILSAKCFEAGIYSDIYLADYNQYSQEIFDERSGLFTFNPDLIILFIDLKSWVGDYYFLPYDLSEEERRGLAAQKENELLNLLNKLKEKTSAKIILHNFEVPHYSPLGILENKQEFGFVESVEKINEGLRNFCKKDGQIFLFDFNSFLSNLGKDKAVDQKMYYLGDIKISPQVLPVLCDSYLSYIKPLSSRIKKCIILDLDNTLWGGIIGEDGVGGIKLGPTPEGRPFWEFQKYLLSLLNRGVILAINSKNNLDEVKDVFKNHPHMVLKEDHFAASRINWNDKATNIREIAAELNIGLDSLVFFDDDKINRDLVSSSLPEVLVPDFSLDPAMYVDALQAINDFNLLQITEEDKEKKTMYLEQKKRKEFESEVSDISEYLRGLNMEVEIGELNDFNLDRLAQLVLKTNQFNLTTRRHAVEDILKFKKEGYLILSIKVKDRFGDNGIVGLVIVRQDLLEWRIDTFLLSCRVIGRKIEEAILSYLVARAKKIGVPKVVGEFIPTKKNGPAKDFYKNNNFILEEKNGEMEIWSFDSEKNDFVAPNIIKLIDNL